MTDKEFIYIWNKIAKMTVLVLEDNLSYNESKISSNFKKIEDDFKDKIYDNECIIGKINPVIIRIKNYAKTTKNKELDNQAKNLAQVMMNFNKTLNNIPENLKLIIKDLKALINCKEKTNIKVKKLKILFEKLSFQKVKLDSIQKITLDISKELEDADAILFGNGYNDGFSKFLKKLLDITEEYNITKLKHAQKKFYLSKELGDFMYGKKNPKLAHLLGKNFNGEKDLPPYEEGSEEEKKQNIDKTTRYELKTPFGSVWVGSGKYGNGRVISLMKNTEHAPNYDTMCTELDKEFDPKTKVKGKYNSIEQIIKPIKAYINQPLTKDVSVLTKIGVTCPQYLLLTQIKVPYHSKYPLNQKQKGAAAFLCGVLLLSESHEARNPTGGKFERKAIKNVLRLAKNGCQNPFGVVFNGEKGRYIPAHSAKQAKTNEGKITGGQNQMQLILKGEVPITVFLEKKDNKKLKNKIESANSKYCKDYRGKAKSYMQNIYGITIQGDIEKAVIGAKKLTNDQSKRDQAINDLEQIKKYVKNLEEIFNNNNQENYIVNIDKLPNFPDDSLIVKFKKLILQKNISKINKLMNNSIR